MELRKSSDRSCPVHFLDIFRNTRLQYKRELPLFPEAFYHPRLDKYELHGLTVHVANLSLREREIVAAKVFQVLRQHAELCIQQNPGTGTGSARQRSTSWSLVWYIAVESSIDLQGKFRATPEVEKLPTIFATHRGPSRPPPRLNEAELLAINALGKPEGGRWGAQNPPVPACGHECDATNLRQHHEVLRNGRYWNFNHAGRCLINKIEQLQSAETAQHKDTSPATDTKLDQSDGAVDSPNVLKPEHPESTSSSSSTSFHDAMSSLSNQTSDSGRTWHSFPSRHQASDDDEKSDECPVAQDPVSSDAASEQKAEGQNNEAAKELASSTTSTEHRERDNVEADDSISSSTHAGHAELPTQVHTPQQGHRGRAVDQGHVESAAGRNGVDRAAEVGEAEHTTAAASPVPQSAPSQRKRRKWIKQDLSDWNL